MSARDEDGRAAVRLRWIAVLSLAVFASELFLPSSLAVGGLYLIVVLGSFWWRRRRAVLFATGVAAGLTLASLFLVTPEPLGPALVNRAVILFALGVTAALGLARTRIETNLEQSRRTLIVTLESLGEGVLTTESGDRVAYLNPAAEALLGWTDAEAHGRPLRELLRPDSEGGGAGELGAALEDVLPMRRVLRLRTRAGDVLDIEATVTPRSAGGGRVLVLRDLSGRRRQPAVEERPAHRNAPDHRQAGHAEEPRT